MKKVFKEFVYFCDSIGLFSGKLASIDGSKFKANNSREKNFTKETLEKKIKRIEKSVNRYLEELKENDEKLDRYIAMDDDSGSSSLPEEHSKTAPSVAEEQLTNPQAHLLLLLLLPTTDTLKQEFSENFSRRKAITKSG